LLYISLAVGFVLAILSVLGYHEELDKILSFLSIILPITAGGLINKAIEVSLAKKKCCLRAGTWSA
jgi:hypothetical protein